MVKSFLSIITSLENWVPRLLSNITVTVLFIPIPVCFSIVISLKRGSLGTAVEVQFLIYICTISSMLIYTF